jgi:hypothetical protein
LAEHLPQTDDGEEDPSTAVNIVLALLIALAVFVGGWWVFAGPSGKLTPMTTTISSEQNRAPSSAAESSGQ